MEQHLLKRKRFYAKKLTKIQQYDLNNLNEDQINAIQRKQEYMNIIEEIDSLLLIHENEKLEILELQNKLLEKSKTCDVLNEKLKFALKMQHFLQKPILELTNELCCDEELLDLLKNYKQMSPDQIHEFMLDLWENQELQQKLTPKTTKKITFGGGPCEQVKVNMSLPLQFGGNAVAAEKIIEVNGFKLKLK